MKGVYQSIRLAEVDHWFFMSISCWANFVSRASAWWSMSMSPTHASGILSTLMELLSVSRERETRQRSSRAAPDVVMGGNRSCFPS